MRIAFFSFLLITCTVVNGQSWEYYSLRKGETLYSICKTFGVHPDSLLKWNDLNENSIVFSPLRLRLKKGENGIVNYPYKVKKGEYLYLLSRKFNVEVSEIISSNSLKNNNLHEGQEISIPLTLLQLDSLQFLGDGFLKDIFFNPIEMIKKACWHEVFTNENWSQIGKNYHISNDSLFKLNPLSDTSYLQRGEKVLVGYITNSIRFQENHQGWELIHLTASILETSNDKNITNKSLVFCNLSPKDTKVKLISKTSGRECWAKVVSSIPKLDRYAGKELLLSKAAYEQLRLSNPEHRLEVWIPKQPTSP